MMRGKKRETVGERREGEGHGSPRPTCQRRSHARTLRQNAARVRGRLGVGVSVRSKDAGEGEGGCECETEGGCKCEVRGKDVSEGAGEAC